MNKEFLTSEERSKATIKDIDEYYDSHNHPIYGLSHGEIDRLCNMLYFNYIRNRKSDKKEDN